MATSSSSHDGPSNFKRRRMEGDGTSTLKPQDHDIGSKDKDEAMQGGCNSNFKPQGNESGSKDKDEAMQGGCNSTFKPQGNDSGSKDAYPASQDSMWSATTLRFGQAADEDQDMNGSQDLKDTEVLPPVVDEDYFGWEEDEDWYDPPYHPGLEDNPEVFAPGLVPVPDPRNPIAPNGMRRTLGQGSARPTPIAGQPSPPTEPPNR